MKRTKYILRFDDASPYMLREGWEKAERIADKYGIEPIVGIVPDCTDNVIMHDAFDPDFFAVTAARWKNKNWTIAQHGLHHTCFFKADGKPTEFSTLPYEKQLEMIKTGYNKLIDNGVYPECFYAPLHSFDENTVKACSDAGVFGFISDGCSCFPYFENGMAFLPNLFDTPKRIFVPGVYTFVCHPSNVSDEYFDFLDGFLRENRECFVNAGEYMSGVKIKNGRRIEDKLIFYALKQMRRRRKR